MEDNLMLTWFHAGFLLAKNPYWVDYQGLLPQAAAEHFRFCTGGATEEDYEAFCAGVEAHRELHAPR